MTAGRRIFIGDVQGCADELLDLLDVLQPSADDSIYFVGDLVNRGPKSLEALHIARKHATGIVLGNHEAHLLVNRFFEDRTHAIATFPKLEDVARAEDWQELGEWIRSWPLVLPLGDLCMVHGAMPPSLWHPDSKIGEWAGRTFSNDEQTWFVLSTRYCTNTGQVPDRDYPDPGPPYLPWDRHYRGPWAAVFGHWARRGSFRGERVVGLDSGCVYGRELTAWIAEEDRFVAIPARQRY